MVFSLDWSMEVEERNASQSVIKFYLFQCWGRHFGYFRYKDPNASLKYNFRSNESEGGREVERIYRIKLFVLAAKVIS